MQPLVTVIIPVYNDYERLSLCLRALARQRYPAAEFEVLVVDNGSVKVPGLAAPASLNVRYLRENGAGSYAARNLGIREGRCEIFAFLDSDCIPEPDWLRAGLAGMSALPGPGYVAGSVELFAENPARPTATEYYEMATGFPIRAYLAERHFGPTANLFVHRDVFAQCGVFDAALQSGGDVEFGLRVYKAGIPQGYAADAVVRHPARHSLRERLVKSYRVLAGLLDLAEKGIDPAVGVQRQLDSLWHLKPPVKRLVRLLVSPLRKQPVHGRLQAGLVTLALHYAEWFEYVRIRKLGLAPRGKR